MSNENESKNFAIEAPETVAKNATKEADGLLELAQEFEIDCIEMATIADEELATIKGKIKELDEKRFAITRPMDEAKKRVMELFAPATARLIQAEAHLKNLLIGWNNKEKLRLAEEQRVAAENQRKVAADAEAEAEKLRRQAIQADVAGDTETAVQLMEQAEMQSQVAENIQYMAPIVGSATKLGNSSVRSNWKAQMTDKMLLIKAIAAGTASVDLVEFAQSVADKRAKALKKEFVVPGIRVYEEDIVASRAKK